MDIKFVISRIRNKTVSIKMKEEVGMSKPTKIYVDKVGKVLPQEGVPTSHFHITFKLHKYLHCH